MRFNNWLYIIKSKEWGKVTVSFCNGLILLVTFLSFSLKCSEKFHFLASNRRSCFRLNFLFYGMRLLKETSGWFLIYFLWEKITSWACLETLELNDVFHWYAHWGISSKELNKKVCFFKKVSQKLIISQNW